MALPDDQYPAWLWTVLDDNKAKLESGKKENGEVDFAMQKKRLRAQYVFDHLCDIELKLISGIERILKLQITSRRHSDFQDKDWCTQGMIIGRPISGATIQDEEPYVVHICIQPITLSLLKRSSPPPARPRDTYPSCQLSILSSS